MSKSFYPTKQFDSITDAVAYCRAHASSQDAVNYLHRIGTEAPDKHAALKAVVCALIDMGEQEFAADLITEYDTAKTITVHMRGAQQLTRTFHRPTTVREFLESVGTVFNTDSKIVWPDVLLKNGDTFEIQ